MVIKTAHRRGAAMMIVLSAIAISVTLGVAMLSSASLQAQVAKNTRSIPTAEALADTGLDLACYYLLYPWKASVDPNSYWTGQNDIPLGSGAGGTVDVAVTSNGNGDYTITSTGKIAGTTIRRTTKATVHVDPGFVTKYGLATNKDGFTIPLFSAINSNVQGKNNFLNLGTINGTVRATGFTNSGSGLLSFLTLTTDESTDVPAADKITDFRTYKYQGTTYSATTIGTTLSAGTVLAPTTSNPAGVFYRNGNLDILGNVSITGTLLVDGNLNIQNSGNTFTAMPGFPAAVVKNGLDMRAWQWGMAALTVNGLMWVHGDIDSSFVNGSFTVLFPGTLTVNGALLVHDGKVAHTDRLRLKITENRDLVGIVPLNKNTPPAGVTFLTNN